MAVGYGERPSQARLFVGRGGTWPTPYTVAYYTQFLVLVKRAECVLSATPRSL